MSLQLKRTVLFFLRLLSRVGWLPWKPGHGERLI